MDSSLNAPAESPRPEGGVEDLLQSPATAVALGGRIYRVGVWRKYLLVLLSNILCCTVILKIAEIQYLELIFAVDFLCLIALLWWQGFQLQVFRPFLEVANSYLIFLVCAFVLSLLALQQDFSYSIHSSPLKAPVLVTVARMAELFLDSFYMLYLAALYRDDEKLCKLGAMTYLWTAIAGCVYSFATYPLNVLSGAQLGTYSLDHRFRGFDNEGGGFGVYLVSAGVLAAVMHRQRWITRAQLMGSGAIMTAGLIGSQSKSAVFALAFLGLTCLGWFQRGWKRWVLLGGLGAGLLAVGSIIDIGAQLALYRTRSEQYQQLSNLRSNDANFVMGRVAGAVIAPRMIAARPLLGIGWGNYPLVRDDADYRRGTAFAIGTTDAPSLGIVDYVVELGIPLWLYLTWIELKPVFMLRQRKVDPWLIALALIQPVSNWAGAHLNLMHPWVVVAFALGLGYARQPAEPSYSDPDTA